MSLTMRSQVSPLPRPPRCLSPNGPTSLTRSRSPSPLCSPAVSSEDLETSADCYFGSKSHTSLPSLAAATSAPTTDKESEQATTPLRLVQPRPRRAATAPLPIPPKFRVPRELRMSSLSPSSPTDVSYNSRCLPLSPMKRSYPMSPDKPADLVALSSRERRPGPIQIRPRSASPRPLSPAQSTPIPGLTVTGANGHAVPLESASVPMPRTPRTPLTASPHTASAPSTAGSATVVPFTARALRSPGCDAVWSRRRASAGEAEDLDKPVHIEFSDLTL